MLLYFSTALLSWIILSIIAVLNIAESSIFALIGYLVIYILLVFFQAKDWCIGCPYRGKFCPGILCMGLANIVSTVLFKNVKFKFSKNKEHLVSVLTGIYFFYPIFFLYDDFLLVASYVTLLIIHLLLVWKFFCPKCKFNEICPGGKISSKIFN